MVSHLVFFTIFTVHTGFYDSNISLEEGNEMRIYLNTSGIPRSDIILTVGVELATAEEEGTEVHAQERDYVLLHTFFHRFYFDKSAVHDYPCHSGALHNFSS